MIARENLKNQWGWRGWKSAKSFASGAAAAFLTTFFLPETTATTSSCRSLWRQLLLRKALFILGFPYCFIFSVFFSFILLSFLFSLFWSRKSGTYDLRRCKNDGITLFTKLQVQINKVFGFYLRMNERVLFFDGLLNGAKWITHGSPISFPSDKFLGS